jgi:hypothetical protein
MLELIHIHKSPLQDRERKRKRNTKRKGIKITLSNASKDEIYTNGKTM